jgi:hypothetical protein
MVVASEAEGGHEVRYPVGRYMEKQEAFNLLTSGEMLQCLFKKKDGVITSRNVQGEKVGGLKWPYVSVKDMAKVRQNIPPYINISMDRVIAVVHGGAMHLVKQPTVVEVLEDARDAK